jgi:threonylcarbamoyladenosine tRNA methylthiotransferase MtaB
LISPLWKRGVRGDFLIIISMKIAIQTLGCKVNQSESASIEGNLLNNNHQIVKHDDTPDICIINTCTVTAKSDYQSRQLIRKAARSGAKVIVTGCYAQLKPDDLANIEGVTKVIGNADKNNILNIIAGLDGITDKETIKITSPDFPLFKQPYHSTRTRAFLKIQDGCNLSCSYCAINRARGKSRSLNVENAIKSALSMEKDGYKEIVLTGIHIGSYGFDLNPRSSLSEIVHTLSGACPKIRFRLSSLEPSEINRELLLLLKRNNICNHLHVPLQSGSDKILKSMNRGYSTSSFKQVINRIVKEYPQTSIGTDVIVGFPGETEEDFNHTMQFIESMPFSYLHVFPYSRRPDTRAFSMDEQIKDTIKKDRVKKLLELGKIMKINYLTKHLGSTLNVIVEKTSSTHGYYNAISDNYLKLLVKGNGIRPGDRLDVNVISLTGSNLIAQALD